MKDETQDDAKRYNKRTKRPTNMKQRIMSLCILGAICHTVAGQEYDTCHWTLDECVTFALEHSPAVRRSELSVETAQANLKERAAAFLPSLSADVGVQFNWGRNIDPETNSYNDVSTFNNNYGLCASFVAFDGGASYYAWREAKVARQRAMNETQRQKDDKAIEVMQAFVDAAYYYRSVELAEKKVADSRELLRQTTIQEQEGLKSAPDLAQAQAQVAADEYALLAQKNQRHIALIGLRKSMNAKAVVVPLLKEKANTPNAITPNGALLQLSLANDAAEQARLQWLSAKGSLLPTLNIDAGIATNYFKTLGGYADAAQHFGSQFHNNMGEYVVATVSIPLFDRKVRRSNVSRAQIEWQSAKADCEEAELEFESNRLKAIADCEGCKQEIVSLERRVEADSLSHFMNTRKYEEGLLSQIELRTSANNLAESRLLLLRQQMLLILKEILVEYYGQNN